jgi:hypothetical protein
VSNSTRKAEDMLRDWTEAQRKAWEGWLETLRTFQGHPASQAWEKSLEAFKDSMNKALDAQADSARMWAETLRNWSTEVHETTARQDGTEPQVEGTRVWADSLTAWAAEVEETTRSWTEAQKQLWQGWYETMKKLDPSKPAAAWGDEGGDLMRIWQESVRKALETQAEWGRTWVTGQQRKGSGGGRGQQRKGSGGGRGRRAPKSTA